MNNHIRKKLRKLVRDPRQFFLDAKLLGTVLRPFIGRPLRPFPSNQPPLRSLELPHRISNLASDESLVELMDKEGFKSLIFFWDVPEQLKATLRQDLAESLIIYVSQTPNTAQSIETFLKHHQLPSHYVFFATLQGNKKNVPPEIQKLAVSAGISIKEFSHDRKKPVIRSQRFYFPVSSQSALIRLLNNADLSDESRMQEIPNLIRLMRDLQVGPWPDYACNLLKNFTSAANLPYVLVIGDHDLTSSESRSKELAIIQTAKEEAQGLGVIYVPCPNQNKYLLTEKNFFKKIQQYSIPVIATVSMADAITGAQRVYTRRSPGALFALLHAIPVTVFESTFYAGWGLTGDRFSCEGRTRSLSLEQLFYIFFILYQKYEHISNNITSNFIIYLLKISGERYKNSIRLYSDEYCQKSPHIVGQTEFWPLLLSKKNLPVLLNKYNQDLTTLFPIKNLLEKIPDANARFVLCFLFAGIIRNTSAWKDFILTLSHSLPPSQLREIFKIWNALISSQILVDNLISTCEKQGDSEYIRQLLHGILKGKEYDCSSSDYTLVPSDKYKYALRLAAFEVRERNLDSALKILLSLLFSGFHTEDILYYLIIASKYRFCFATAKLLSYILITAFPTWKTNIILALYTDASVTENNIAEALPILAELVKNGTEVPNFTYLQKKLNYIYGEYHWQNIFSSMSKEETSIAKANACLLGGDYKQAYLYLHDVTPTPSELKDYFKAFTQYFILSGNFKETDTFLNYMSNKIPKPLFYSKSIEIALNRKHYSEAKKLYKKCLDAKIEIMPPIQYRMQYILQDFHGALETINTMINNKVFTNVMGGRTLTRLDDIDPNVVRSLLVLVESGPGDEIRGASHYRQIVQRAGVERVVFTCDERLYKLFKRSFPDLTFHPFTRFRHYSYITDSSLFSRVPSSELVWMMDNSVWDASQTFDKVIRYFSARVSVVNSYADIAGTPFLKADPEIKAELRSRLKKDQKLLVGLCWRSSLQSGVRNAAFFSPEELTPLLELDNVQFVNCQSDGCTGDEKRFFEKYPGKLLDVADIDQYNDFDATAALYSALDLMISCPNTVMELAGALGVPTLTFTLTYEPDLHLKPNCNCNVYYNSVIHVGYDIPVYQHNEVMHKLKTELQCMADISTGDNMQK